MQEAKELSGNNPAVVTLANSVELSRGAVGGPKRTVDVVEPLEAHVYKITFRGGETAAWRSAAMEACGLDFDRRETATSIASAVVPATIAWRAGCPKERNLGGIKVVNRGRVPNRDIMATNRHEFRCPRAPEHPEGGTLRVVVVWPSHFRGVPVGAPFLGGPPMSRQHFPRWMADVAAVIVAGLGLGFGPSRSWTADAPLPAEERAKRDDL